MADPQSPEHPGAAARTGRANRRVRRPGLSAMALAVGLGLAGWEGTLGRSSAGARVSVVVVFALVLVAAAAAGRGRQRTTTADWLRRAVSRLRTSSPPDAGSVDRLPARGAGVVWAALIAATVGWDLYSFGRQEHDLPTLSRLAGDVTAHEWGRALFFALWLALGAYLALGWRSPPRRRARSAVGRVERAAGEGGATPPGRADGEAAVDPPPGPR